MMNSNFEKQAFDRGYMDTLVTLGLVTSKQADLQKEALPFVGNLASKGIGFLGKGLKSFAGRFGNKGIQAGAQGVQAGAQAGAQAAAKPGMMGKAWKALNSTPAMVGMLGASSIPTNF